MTNPWLAVAGVSGAVAVLCGAFGAHALTSRLAEAQLAVWRTAALYHLVHSAALLAVAVGLPADRRALPAALFAAGIVLFSGSLYALSLGAPRWLGPVTPLGGVAFVLGWLAVALRSLGPRG